MNIGKCHIIATDKALSNIDPNTISEAKLIDIILYYRVSF